MIYEITGRIHGSRVTVFIPADSIEEATREGSEIIAEMADTCGSVDIEASRCIPVDDIPPVH